MAAAHVSIGSASSTRGRGSVRKAPGLPATSCESAAQHASPKQAPDRKAVPRQASPRQAMSRQTGTPRQVTPRECAPRCSARVQGSARVARSGRSATAAPILVVASPRSGGCGKVAVTTPRARGAGITARECESKAAEELRELLGPRWQELSAASVREIVAWKLKDAPKNVPQDAQKRSDKDPEAVEQLAEPEAEGTLDELTCAKAAIR